MSPSGGDRTVRVLSRPGCHLCSEAESRIATIVDGDPTVAIEVVDIDSDPDLLGRYLERIPVVEVDGVEVSELEFDADAFRVALDARPDGPGQ